jgi:hypothetical protein
VLIDWTGEFDQDFDRLQARSKTDEHARAQYRHLLAELDVLQGLDGAPVQDSPTLKRSGSLASTSYGECRTPITTTWRCA